MLPVIQYAVPVRLLTNKKSLVPLLTWIIYDPLLKFVGGLKMWGLDYKFFLLKDPFGAAFHADKIASPVVQPVRVQVASGSSVENDLVKVGQRVLAVGTGAGDDISGVAEIPGLGGPCNAPLVLGTDPGVDERTIFFGPDGHDDLGVGGAAHDANLSREDRGLGGRGPEVVPVVDKSEDENNGDKHTN